MTTRSAEMSFSRSAQRIVVPRVRAGVDVGFSEENDGDSAADGRSVTAAGGADDFKIDLGVEEEHGMVELFVLTRRLAAS